MPNWKKFNPFKARKRNKGETPSTLQPPPPQPQSLVGMPNSRMIASARSQAQQLVNQRYPHRTEFEVIGHIRSLLQPIEEIALQQGLPKEQFEAWYQSLKPELSSRSLTLERAEVVARLLSDALTMAHEHPIVEVDEGRRRLIPELTITNLFSPQHTLKVAGELAVTDGILEIYSAFLATARTEHEKVELSYWRVSLDDALKEYLKEKKISNFVLKALEYDMEVLRILAERCPLVDGQTNTIIPFFKVDAVMQHVKRHVDSEQSRRGTSSVASDGWM